MANDLARQWSWGTLVSLLGLVCALILGAKLYGLYDRDGRRPDHSTVDEIIPVFHLVTVGTWIAFLVSAELDLGWRIGTIGVFWATAITTIIVGRAIARFVVRRQPAFTQNTIIVGAGDVGQLIGRKLRQHPEYGMRLLGFVDADPKEMRTDLDGMPILGQIDQIEKLVETHNVQRAIVAFSNDRHQDLLTLVRMLRKLGVQTDLVPRLFEAVGPSVGMHSVEGLALVGLLPSHMSRTGWIAKRTFDVLVASVLLLVTAPLFLWIAWRVRADSSGPAFFRQTRLGKGKRPFSMLKFRTMTVGMDESAHRDYVAQIMDTRVAPTSSNLYKLEQPESVTRVGAWLRRTSLDELPQLLNVIRGEMSLVGPRPCIPYEAELFDPHHFDRFLVPAGMTGLWQVAARSNATLREALDLDAAYARNWSFRLDLSLLARTPIVTLRRRQTT